MQVHTMQRAAAEHGMLQTWVQILLSKPYLLLLLQPRREYFSMTLEAKCIDLQVKYVLGRRREKNTYAAHIAR